MYSTKIKPGSGAFHLRFINGKYTSCKDLKSTYIMRAGHKDEILNMGIADDDFLDETSMAYVLNTVYMYVYCNLIIRGIMM